MSITVEIERRNRIRLSLAAYAYEFDSITIIPDSEFDKLALSINPGFSTGNELLDDFFRNEFNNYSGQWVYNHPELDKLAELYKRVFKGESVNFDLKYNKDLLSPLKVKQDVIKHSDPVIKNTTKPKNPCRRCSRDKTLNPLNGGCYC